jgi:hypothetical protein
MDFKKLSLEQLQVELKKLVKPLQKDFAPLLYHLREKMKAPGRKGEGWGVWVRKHLPFSLKTATNWANEYGVASDLMKAQKRTSGKSARGSQPDVFQYVEIVARPTWFTKTEEKKLHRAIERVGGQVEAFHIFFHAVIKAANGKALSAHA